MNFNQLDLEAKKQLHDEVLANAMSLGGKNFFLQLIEDFKKEKPNPLLNKSAAFHFSKGRVCWSKPIYKDTMSLLWDAMRREEKKGDMLDGINPKEYKAVMNMMRALSSIDITVTPRKPRNEEDTEDVETSKGFTFSMLDTSVEKKTRVTLMFKIIFFYNIDFAKEVLNYEPKN